MLHSINGEDFILVVKGLYISIYIGATFFDGPKKDLVRSTENTPIKKMFVISVAGASVLPTNAEDSCDCV